MGDYLLHERKTGEATTGEHASHQHGARPPETGLLYAVDDIARMARVTKAVVVRLCLEGLMPGWVEVDGRRYWRRTSAVEAVAQASRVHPRQDAA